MGWQKIARVLFAAAIMAALGGALTARAEEVHASIVNVASDVPFFIAEKKGYFRDEGLTVHYTAFDSIAKMIAPLAAGQLDVGGGGAPAGLYNAVARGIDIKIVADKAHDEPGYSYEALMVRKDLVDSGRFKSYADLKGLKVAINGVGSGENATINEALKRGGLTFRDIEPVHLGFPEHPGALANKGVDSTLTTEPTLTFIARSGLAVPFERITAFYPNKEVAMLFYGARFMRERPETARKFMRAYIRAARFYNDALQGGRLAGPRGEEVIAILTEYSNIKDPEVYRSITPHALHPDGALNLESLRTDWRFFKEQGLLQGKVTPDDVYDGALAAAVAAELGPYRRINR